MQVAKKSTIKSITFVTTEDWRRGGEIHVVFYLGLEQKDSHKVLLE